MPETDVDEYLLLGVGDGSVIVFGAGDGQPDSERIVALRQAAKNATETLGAAGDTYTWTALIGHPTDTILAHHIRLDSEISIGSMRLESTGIVYEEVGPAQNPSYSSWTMSASVPIRVHGTSRGFDWPSASITAARDLRLLCALLSVAWDTALTVRESAAPLDWGVRTPPERPPWRREDAAPQDRAGLPGTVPEVPPWLEEAWSRLLNDNRLQSALNIYLEGAYVESRHSSLAAVAYTACVETIAEKLYKLESCSQCGMKFGITRSFKAAIGLVCSDEDARLLDAVYGARSRTVHSGRLHGEETVPGAESLTWSNNAAQDFRWRTLWRLRRACTALLGKALQGDLPPRVRLLAT
jgi:hypothetical protein